MLVVSPLSCCTNESEGEMEIFSIRPDDFSSGILLDDIDDLFISMGKGEVLPADLEMVEDMFAEFLVSGDVESEIILSVSNNGKVEENGSKEEEDKGWGSNSSQGEQIMSKRNESLKVNRGTKVADKGRKSSKNQMKSSPGKRKVKVDWTPELHRRFVQAVEQLGMDKAVPSRILELMGIDCLTRHNIASHLQKYRLHQKDLRAREAEAAMWNQRRQVYGGTQGGGKRYVEMMSPRPPVPTMIGFPPPTPLHSYRHMHVWGHPTLRHQSLMIHTWSEHLAPWPAQPLPAPPPPGHSYWHPPHHQRFRAPPVPGVPPHFMHKAENGIGIPTSGQIHSDPPFDFYPSKESIDGAIGDALSKPRLPLPLGLKPPSLETVLIELQLEGISKIPPTSCS